MSITSWKRSREVNRSWNRTARRSRRFSSSLYKGFAKQEKSFQKEHAKWDEGLQPIVQKLSRFDRGLPSASKIPFQLYQGEFATVVGLSVHFVEMVKQPDQHITEYVGLEHEVTDKTAVQGGQAVTRTIPGEIEPEETDSGHLYITNNRVVFKGSAYSKTWHWGDNQWTNESWWIGFSGTDGPKSGFSGLSVTDFKFYLDWIEAVENQSTDNFRARLQSALDGYRRKEPVLSLQVKDSFEFKERPRLWAGVEDLEQRRSAVARLVAGIASCAANEKLESQLSPVVHDAEFPTDLFVEDVLALVATIMSQHSGRKALCESLGVPWVESAKPFAESREWFPVLRGIVAEGSKPDVAVLYAASMMSVLRWAAATTTSALYSEIVCQLATFLTGVAASTGMAKESFGSLHRAVIHSTSARRDQATFRPLPLKSGDN